jgi:hypothetical protein
MATTNVFQTGAFQSDTFQGTTDVVSTPAVASTSSGKPTAAVTVTVTLPTGIVAGNLLILIFGNDQTLVGDPTVSGGWTKLASFQNTSGGLGADRFSAYYKTAVGGDTCTVQNFDATSTNVAYVCYRISGHDSAAAPEIATSTSVPNLPKASGRQVDPPSIVPSWGSGVDTYFIAAVGLSQVIAESVVQPSSHPLNRINTTSASSVTTYAAGSLQNATSGSNDPSVFSFGVGTSFSSDVFQLSGASLTIAVKGGAAAAIDIPFIYDSSNDVIMDSFAVEFYSDLGTESVAPLSDDLIIVDLDIQESVFDDTVEDIDWDWDNWSWSQAPPIDDNNPEIAPTTLDDQDFSDLSDYGTQTDEPIEDNNPDVSLASVALDEQDFSDTDDYGTQTDVAIPDNNPDVSLSAVSLDDQDFTDTTDYGFNSEPLSDDNNPDISPSSLDDQDFTDTADYGFDSEPAVDDFVVPPEDFILGASTNLDDQDWSDHWDYGFSSDPTIDDFTLREDQLLGLPDGLDDQDWTDTWDYGSSVDQLSIDNNDFVLGDGAGLDDQDWTDQADYGEIINPAIPDNDQEFRPDMVVLDNQDWTDQDDYGFINNPDPSLDEQDPDLSLIDSDSQDWTDTWDYGFQTDQAIGDNNSETAPSALDDQDFTDTADYGYFDIPTQADFVVPQDFALGTGAGLDDQDFTDLSEYGFSFEPERNNVQPPTLVFLTGYDIYVLPSDACQIIVVIWNNGLEPSAFWVEVTQPSNSWTEVSQPALTWTAVSDVSQAWSEIPDVNLNWNQVC